MKITEIGIKTGLVKISLVSTIPDTGRIIYKIPSLKKNGVPFTTEKMYQQQFQEKVLIIYSIFKNMSWI